MSHRVQILPHMAQLKQSLLGTSSVQGYCEGTGIAFVCIHLGVHLKKVALASWGQSHEVRHIPQTEGEDIVLGAEPFGSLVDSLTLNNWWACLHTHYSWLLLADSSWFVI